MTEKNNSLIIIDGYGFIFRAYHVQPPLTSPSGIPVGAVYGFTSMLLKVLNDFKPSHAVVVFDTGGTNFRHNIYNEYKAHRPPAPVDLIEQFPIARIAASSLNFPIIEMEGYEADDIIATLAIKASSKNEKAIIISSDKDLMQLIDGNVQMYDPIKAKYITHEDVIAKFGVGPDKVREVLALMGDASDNIPGVAGVGPKTASALVNQFGTVQNIINSKAEITNPRWQRLIEEGQKRLELSWELVGLDCNVDLGVTLDLLAYFPPDPTVASDFLSSYGFKSLYKRAEHVFEYKIEANHTQASSANSNLSQTILAEELKSIDDFDKMHTAAKRSGVVSLYLASEKGEYTDLIFAVEDKSYIIHISKEHNQNEIAKDLFQYESNTGAVAWYVKQLAVLLKDPSIKKITYNLKSVLQFIEKSFPKADIKACEAMGFEDLALMEYAISAGKKQEDLFAEVKSEINKYPDIVLKFFSRYQELLSELVDTKSLHLYKEVDLPICYIINAMEVDGIKVDELALQKLSQSFGTELLHLEKAIFTIAGQEFNIGSPKQLGEILFDKMQLPFGKVSGKTKTYATGVEILEKLSEAKYEIADLILKWRQLSKLKNTYSDSLPSHINKATGRVHTTFLQTSTSTGRFSSHDPNLQNIPIRSSEGNKIRSAFIASPGCKLISADYSQIELRILSCITKEPVFIKAFLNGEDIHAQTACNIFKLSKEELTPEYRRRAKAINFGIIYGISGFGLAKQLGIPSSEAAEYIKQYFEKHPTVYEYMEKTKQYAREHGFVKNIFGRKCFLSSIKDKNYALRQFAERAAINAPLQGTTSDIVKIAMVKVSAALKQQNFKTKMLLQIHDELVFEAPNEEIETVIPLIKNTMEQAAALSVPLPVEVKVGSNWFDMV